MVEKVTRGKWVRFIGCWVTNAHIGIHLNNPKSYGYNEYDEINKPEVLFSVRKHLYLSKVVLIIMSIFLICGCLKFWFSSNL